MTGAATTAAAGDSGGITSGGLVAIELAPGLVAPHPANPREDLGDLTELEASVRELGVLEPLVVATVAAHRAGGWPGVDAAATHVVLAGHRRRAAAIAAGLDVVPCVIRDDLAGDDALAVMLSENDPAKRHGLTPLAEARAYAQLAERVWSQRKIAARMGCKQPHVSKRVALLRLPAEAISALTAGKLTAADGTELARLAGHPERAVKALAEIDGSTFNNAAAVVGRHLQQAEREKNAAATRAQLEAEGIPVVDPGQMGAYAYARRLDDGAGTELHRAAGCLRGAASSHSGSRELYCRDPDSHEGTAAALPGWSRSYGSGRAAADAERAEENRHRAAAARARREAAARLAARPVPAARAAELLSLALISRHVDAACLKTAAGWLRAAGIGPADGDAYAYAAQVTASGDLAAIRRLATAMALAADEQTAGAEYAGVWGDRQIAYLDRLVSEAGYQPGEREQARLAEARARVQARAELSCPDCGCRYTRRCAESYSRCDAEPAGDGTWRYRCHDRKPASAAPAAGDDDRTGEDTDELDEALEDLLIAVDPSTSAGQELPEALDAAITDAAAAFGAAYNYQSGSEDPGELLAAARDLRAAALPHEAEWTPPLRDALARLDAIGAGQ
jgi:ParB/RepB/Spo0J family partition protein